MLPPNRSQGKRKRINLPRLDVYFGMKVPQITRLVSVSPPIAQILEEPEPAAAADQPIEKKDKFDRTPFSRRISVDGQQGWFRLAGFAVIKGKELAAPTLEQLSKLKELLSNSEQPYYFLVEAAADNRVAQITPYADKREWVAQLRDYGVAGWNSIFEGAQADKEKQLRVLEKLLLEGQRDL